MINHILMCLWAFKALYWLPEIKLVNRFRLWRKTVNLYFSLLVFTDVRRPREQLQRAMVAAFLSAIYDYETDWYPTSQVETSLFSRLLHVWVDDVSVRTIALDLFSADLRMKLSDHGLERGSIALTLYDAIIRSSWMKEYSPEQVTQFGRKLQIIDDLLDIKTDARNHQKNCLLIPGREVYLQEVKEFMSSDFWRQLMSRSGIYRVLTWKCQQEINRLEGVIPSWHETYNACRSLTGMCAAIFAVIGFRYVDAPVLLIIVTAVSFWGIASSIMLFNDLIDREHDRRKQKEFAATHTLWLAEVWVTLSTILILLLVAIAVLAPSLGIFCGGIWLIGLIYSGLRHWCVLQNLVVAVCSAAPVLCGVIYTGELIFKPLLLFVAVTSLIFMREIVKDIEDQGHDTGYKTTIPVTWGHCQAVFILIGLCFVPASLLALYPSPFMRIPAYCFGAVQASNALMLLRPERCRFAKKSLDVAGYVLLSVLLIAP